MIGWVDCGSDCCKSSLRHTFVPFGHPKATIFEKLLLFVRFINSSSPATMERKRNELMGLIGETKDEELLNLLWEQVFLNQPELSPEQVKWLNARLEQSEKSFAEGRVMTHEEVKLMIEGLGDEDRLVG